MNPQSGGIVLAMVMMLGALFTARRSEGREQVLPLIPRPVEVRRDSGEYLLANGASLRVSSVSRDVAELLQADLHQRTGLQLEIQVTADLVGMTMAISAGSFPKLENAWPAPRPEAYTLRIAPAGVFLAGADRAGLYWATRTLLQLLERQGEQWVLPAVTVRDYPRFPRRGLLLDPARNFISLPGLKRQVDLISRLKLNVLHLHLTDDQGWRFESKAFPKLQEIGGQGKFYTQAELRELVAYAAARGVTVMPEIDMPGHTTALLAAYPELSCSGEKLEVSHHVGIHPNALCPAKEEVYDFLQTLLAEVAAVFPSEYIHIGSDEVVAKDWDRCPACEKLLAEKKLTGKKGLHSYFLERVNAIITGLGRKTLAWDEVTDFAPEGVTVQVWHKKNWVTVAVEQGREVISTPNLYTYLDHPRWMLPLWLCYRLDPVPAEVPPPRVKQIKGGGANLWGEFAPEAKLDQKLFPRLPALAEVYWSPQEDRRYLDFRRRLGKLQPELEAQGVKFGR